MKPDNIKIWDGDRWTRATARAWDGAKWIGQATEAGVTIPSPTAAYPPALDELQENLRPEYRATETLYVGPRKQYQTITSALAAIKRAGAPAPHNRVDVIISPGVYVENLKPPTHIALIGATGNPEDVTIRGINAQKDFVGVLYTRGSIYLEGLTIEQPPGLETLSRQEQFTPKYPVHHDHQGTMILSNCVLTARSALAGGGGTCLGVDGGEAGLILAHRTRFESVAGVNVNSHGPNSATGWAITNIYIDCTLDSSTGYQSLDASTGEVYIMGSTTAKGIKTGGPSVSLTLDPAAAPGPVQAAGPVHHSTAYPDVRGAMSPYERTKFYGG